MSPILISLSSFGAAEVRRHGQLWFTHLAQEAGADGVEVRGELLNDDDELPAIADAAARLQRVYSSPEGLWSNDGTLDKAALGRALLGAGRLDAFRLKMSIGGYRKESSSTFDALRDHLADTPIELVIENDQTSSAGTLSALTSFFETAQARGLALGMTFDMGNWHWTGECPLKAAEQFGSKVRYVHCKGVQRQPHRWVAVPLAESSAPWRTVLRAMPAETPWAIEFPLIGDDLLETTRGHVTHLRELSGSLS